MSDDEPDFPHDYKYSELKFSERRVLMVERAEPDDYVNEYSGLIQWSGSDEDNPVILGAFACTLIDADSAINDSRSVEVTFDASSSTWDVYQALYDPETHELRESVVKLAFQDEYSSTYNVLLLDRLVIYPEHRGHGLGLIALRALMQEFRSFVSLIVMKPYPLQFESEEGPTHEPLDGLGREHWKLDAFPRRETVATAKLRKYYSKLGFVRVPKTPYMVRAAVFALPSIDELIED